MAEAEGIPPTASVASVGPGIRYAGKWVYAYSGTFAALDSFQEFLSFSSGSGIIVGKFVMTAFARTAPTIGDGEITVGQILMNNEIAFSGHIGSPAPADMPMLVIVPILIPPETKVVVQLIGASADVNHIATVNLVGRVYDA